ncbi:uncharacterized protein [Lolium perenne]|uniref:uncharacterized protein n=1 Tax=Lolium perenne TaxID=4522 RepID=UPI0021F588F4|nr:uncharacterized protein LOC127315011 [Lolium perenne]
MGDHHYLDTPIWKDILAGIDKFSTISSVTIGNGISTAFWFDAWLGTSPLHVRFPILFSHSACLNLNVATALPHGIHHFLVPRLSAAAASELRDLTVELRSIDDVVTTIWRSDAPLKCKIFCWLARRKRLPTNKWRF